MPAGSSYLRARDAVAQVCAIPHCFFFSHSDHWYRHGNRLVICDCLDRTPVEWNWPDGASYRSVRRAVVTVARTSEHGCHLNLGCNRGRHPRKQAPILGRMVALMIWLIGTWKYYPFVMGLLLIPVLRLRRGWIVLSVWALASLSFVLLTWGNFKFSMQSNSNMTDIADAWVLGRVPVVARMFGSEFPLAGIQFGDVLLGTMALLAAIWGVAAGQRIRISVNADLVGKSMLAISGSSLFLASVLVGGFGWAYKAAFLLLCIPLAARCLASSDRFLIVTGVLVLALTTICSIVVWNTLLASLSGIVAASVAFGVSGFLIILSVTTITSKAKTPPLL